MMPALNFPQITLNTRKVGEQIEVFDRSRKRFIQLTPEEWVRQHCIEFLVNNCNYPRSLIQVEAAFKLGKLTKRSDILVFSLQHKPLLLVECKSPSTVITQNVFDQVARYNQSINALYMLVTNGLQHFCFQKSSIIEQWSFLDHIPKWEELIEE